MITEIIFNLILLPLEFLIGLIPDSSGFPVAVSSNIETAWGYLWAFDYIVPVATLLLLMGLVFAFEAGILVWKFINWVIRKIPGMS